ncbi:MAG: cryptochrome/photolyase family protein [Salibacteraceae bacterium]
MKAHERLLESRGIKVKYIDAQSNLADIRALLDRLSTEGSDVTVHIIDPTDSWLLSRIQSKCEEHSISLSTYDNPIFLNTTKELSSFFRKDKKSFYQTSFYKQERESRKILMDSDGAPTGGKWTFDQDNRKSYPKDKKPPLITGLGDNVHWSEAVDYVQQHFSDNYGLISSDRWYPIDKDEATAWFEDFLETRFHDFGTYEDAIVHNASILNHSLLSPLLNCGLISPQHVIARSIRFASEHDVPINSLEGFIRQIIGWREFIRGMYECKGTYSRSKNFWGFNRKIPQSFYNGTTGIEPLDHTIKKVIETGYCHHIERLMILGNFMLLCEFDPNEVYRWFMELFIDSYDWVMVPNVYGMSQFADGGLFATKPYISGSNYIKKMSNYKSGEWQNVWDGLFWRFMAEHRHFFSKNPRTSMLLSTYDRMSDTKKSSHIQNAEHFLKRL